MSDLLVSPAEGEGEREREREGGRGGSFLAGKQLHVLKRTTETDPDLTVVGRATGNVAVCTVEL